MSTPDIKITIEGRSVKMCPEWTTMEELLTNVLSIEDGALVRISRPDNHTNYTAPGHYLLSYVPHEPAGDEIEIELTVRKT